MTISTSTTSSYSLTKINGEIDASNSVLLEKELDHILTEEETSNIFIECSLLKYISSAGLGVFMSKIDDFAEKGINFVLINVQSNIQDVFKVLGINEFIKMASSVNEAEKIVYGNKSTDN
ncbi:MAG: STAS domain-containing protein [Cyclobacteriaceae bacterium]